MPGPNFPTAAVDGGGAFTWTSPTSVEAADGVYASQIQPPDATPNAINTTGYGFAVTGTVTQVLVEVLCHGHVTGNGPFNTGVNYPISLNVSLLNASGGTLTQNAPFNTPDAWVQFNFTGLSLAAAVVNAAAFGAQLQAGTAPQSTAGTLYIDAIRITVTTAAGGAGAPQVVGETRTIALTQKLVKGDK